MRGVLAAMATLLLLAGCAGRVYYPVTAVRADTLTHVNVSDRDTERQRETIVRDSVIVIRTDSMVTVRETHYERDYSYESRLRSVIDSLLCARRDSVPYPVEVTVTEYRMSPAQRVFFWLGVAAALCLVLFLGKRFL